MKYQKTGKEFLKPGMIYSKTGFYTFQPNFELLKFR